MFQLPEELKREIYTYDNTYKKLFQEQVLNELLRHEMFDHRQWMLDRGYTIRNYFEHWCIIPRYYDQNASKIYGSYIRRRWRCHDPL